MTFDAWVKHQSKLIAEGWERSVDRAWEKNRERNEY